MGPDGRATWTAAARLQEGDQLQAQHARLTVLRSTPLAERHTTHSLAASGPSSNGQKKEPNNSMSISRQREPRLLAREFGSLRCGGPPDCTVQAILFQSGAQFHGGEGNIVRLEFDQRLPAAESEAR